MRKVLCFALVLIGLSIGLVGMAAEEGVLTVVTTTDPPRLDPAVITSYEAGMVTYNIYENLLTYDPTDFSIKPMLAESWEISPDGKSATFHLREGVTFTDGTPFNAEAVRFNVERTKALGLAPATYLEQIVDIVIVDEYTIQFKSSERWAFWEDAMATRKALSIVSPTFIREHATDDDPWAGEYLYDHTCGTGPYMLEQWVHGQYAKLVQNPDYWGGWEGEHFETVFVRTVREPSVEELMLKSGEADIAYEIPETHMAELDARDDIFSQAIPGMAQMFFPIQSHDGPLADVRVRKAVLYALDLETVRTVFPGAGKAHGAIPTTMLGGDESAYAYPYDPDESRRLLGEAGYEPGELSLTLVYIAGAEYQRRAALVVQQNLADVGVNLSVENMPWSTIFPLMADPDQSPEIYMFYSAARFADPHGILYETFHSDALGPGGYNNGYSNPIFDDLLDRAEKTVDRDERAALYREANQILINDAPAVFVWEMPYPFSYREDLQNVVPDVLFRTYDYYRMYRE